MCQQPLSWIGGSSFLLPSHQLQPSAAAATSRVAAFVWLMHSILGDNQCRGALLRHLYFSRDTRTSSPGDGPAGAAESPDASASASALRSCHMPNYTEFKLILCCASRLDRVGLDMTNQHNGQGNKALDQVSPLQEVLYSGGLLHIDRCMYINY